MLFLKASRPLRYPTKAIVKIELILTVNKISVNFDCRLNFLNKISLLSVMVKYWLRRRLVKPYQTVHSHFDFTSSQYKKGSRPMAGALSKVTELIAIFASFSLCFGSLLSYLS